MDTLSLQKNQRWKAGYFYPPLVSIGICGSLLGFLALDTLFWSSGSQILGMLRPTSIWQIATPGVIVTATLIFTKVLPLSWHFRFLRAFIYQVYLQSEPLPSDALFRPLVTTTRNWPAECDYNIHKSNSTYFADMDIARAHLVSCLLKNWLRGTSRIFNPFTSLPNNLKLDGSKRVSIALGAVSCHFRREIPPFAKYEIWTRVLCWGKKWIYILCHFVKSGDVTRGQTSSTETLHINGNASEAKRSASTQIDPPSAAIYATGVTRYVFKEGRITVPPELFLLASGLLPPRQVLSETNLTNLQWDRAKEENERGQKYMEAFIILDEVHENLSECSSKKALGHF